MLKQKAILNDSASKEFIMGKVRDAAWLIKSIQTRQTTIFRVASCIVESQQEFFKKGAKFLFVQSLPAM